MISVFVARSSTAALFCDDHQLATNKDVCPLLRRFGRDRIEHYGTPTVAVRCINADTVQLRCQPYSALRLDRDITGQRSICHERQASTIDAVTWTVQPQNCQPI